MNQAVTHFIGEYLTPSDPVEYKPHTRADGTNALLSRALRKRKANVVTVNKSTAIVYGGKTVGGFQGNLTTLAGVGAHEASKCTITAKSYFTAAGLPVTEGRDFAPSEYEAAKAYFTTRLQDPGAAIKPASSTDGLGISLAIRNVNELAAAWDSAIAKRSRVPSASKRIVLEQFIEGIDVQAFVSGESVISAQARVPLYSVGDGRRSATALIEESAQSRSQNPYLKKFRVNINTLISESPNFDKRYVPPAGEIISLGPWVNVSRGGLTVDVTSLISKDLEDLAVRGAWSVPASSVIAVDLLTPAIDSAEGAVILQIDTEASIAAHKYPWIGRPRPVADHIAKAILAKATY